jgi:phosphatidate phosphatase APP1
MKRSVEIKIYNGYGHSKNLVVYGHVFKWRPKLSGKYDKNSLRHAWGLLKLFMSRPYKKANLKLFFKDQVINSQADHDGFFKFKWASDVHLEAGLHDLRIGLVDFSGEVSHFTRGKVYIPHSTQYVFVSDIDDTILISHSATIWKRLKELLARNPYKRKIFANQVHWYNHLSLSGTDPEHLNPFFYVSSSEWNLYDYLREIFDYNLLPTGSFLLSHFKQWYDFFKTGRTKHEDKYRRIDRLLRVFPKQKFVLIGDNSQRDPIIYTVLANHYPDRVVAIYIRNVKPRKAGISHQLFKNLTNKDIYTCLFNSNQDAFSHSVETGLIRIKRTEVN